MDKIFYDFLETGNESNNSSYSKNATFNILELNEIEVEKLQVFINNY